MSGRALPVTALLDSDALAMFSLFGLTWAIPAAAVHLSHALGGVLRRRAQHAAPAA
ncbi:MAG TPA: hypothetical protein VN193_17240 [Candidatus Angelobacter sp.]|jgi:hypothetical protein|nr:hypothetical protein [Candidatus Angelobacter sp.]